ncbi:ABC transporter ATP-binding protein [Enterococcus crotali]|uniref:ABC transporter ATP-binding protein n=1 Tax=Enterococcus crotali TaxID=1453587 RepID=UPI00046E7F07|nr:ABC transporter ATP-binding protein [Enterococcus crotali]
MNKNVIKYLRICCENKSVKIFSSFILMVLSLLTTFLAPKYLGEIIDNGIIKQNFQVVWTLGCIYLLLYIFSEVVDYVLYNFFNAIKLEGSKKIKERLLINISNANGDQLSKNQTGEFIYIINNDIFRIENFGIEVWFKCVINLLTALGAVVFLVKINVALFLIILSIEVVVIFVQKSYSIKIEKETKLIRKNAGNQSNVQEQYISKIREVILSNSAQYFLRKISKYQDRFIDMAKSINKKLSKSDLVSALSTHLSVITIYVLGGWFIINYNTSLGDLISFTQYMGLFIGSINYLLKAIISLKQTTISLDRIFEELDKQKYDESKESYQDKIYGDIFFNNVTFSYNESKILENFTLKVSKGTVVGIAGESGCGKSTLTYLMYKLWKPEKGSIEIDNIKIEEWELDCLRKQICIVSQESLIIDDSVKMNILWDSNLSDIPIDLLEALELKEIAKGTDIGENGRKLSGGQKQRIAIARAIMKNTPIIILDESTSALDNISQDKIWKNIQPWLAEKTVIIIAHRMELIRNCDYICIIQDGMVVENGTHVDMIENQKEYYRLVNSIS